MRQIIFLLVFLATATAHAVEGMVVIANPKVPVNSISVEDLTLMYLIQNTTWSNGVAVVPVNREASSPTREFFSELLFSRTPSELSEYWNRLRFTEKIPPLVQTSDQAVLGFVRSVPGAIGYVDGNQSLAGAKVLLKLR
jgi:ABC-type phosphate transport system substrate-binding protein